MKFVGFIPVHNRCQQTLRFISSLKNSIPQNEPYDIWVLDDGSTDETELLVPKFYPEVKLCKLDGNCYWGGCINKIKDILIQTYSEEEIYVGLFNNDTVQYQSGVEKAISLLSKYSIICPSVIHVESNEEAENIDLTNINQGSSHGKNIDYGTFFDSERFSFLQKKEPGLTNVSHTVGLITLKSIFLASRKVPSAVPHYLSDYYFTHSASRMGYTIYVSTDYWVSRLENESKGNLKGFSTDILSIKSPLYFPAWIRFRLDFSEEKFKFIFVFKMLLRLFFLRFMRFCHLMAGREITVSNYDS